MRTDRRELMNLAWHLARQELWSHRLPASALRSLFPNALRTAWREMKYRADLAVAQAAKPKRPADEIRAEIFTLENTDRLGFQGIERLSAARAELREVVAAERKAAEEADLAAKRALIASAEGRFCAVTFTKKDGSERTMRVQPAALKFHVKATPRAAPHKRQPPRAPHAIRTFWPSGTRRSGRPAPSTSRPSRASSWTAAHTSTPMQLEEEKTMPNDYVPATAAGLPTRRTLLAALPAIGFAPAAAVAGLPELEADTFAGTEERIRQFAVWFDLEVPPIEYDPEDVAGGPLLTDELYAWIMDNGASFDWIFVGDAKGMAIEFAKAAKDEHRTREMLKQLSPEEARGLNLAMTATIERGVPIKDALAIFDQVAGARVGVTA